MGNQHLKTGDNFTMNITKKQQGFTIIEVMIVLAIAGLIMVVALIAIPQLQRNQRNNARQSVVNRISTEIGNYAGNNNGRLPDINTLQDTFVQRYLNGVNTEDPQTGVPMVILPSSGVTGVPSLTEELVQTSVNENGTPGDPDDDYSEKSGGGDLGVLYYQTNSSCNGESIEAVTGGNRTYVLYTIQEGGAIYCVDNG